MALADALHGLFRLSGATYACVVERDGGRVLAEVGRGEGGAGDDEGAVPYSVAGWGIAVAAMFDTTSGDELDDVMITGRRSYHLVRPLGPGAAVLVYLRLDRARSNLAAARRELAAVRWGAGAGPAAPAPVPAVEPRRNRGAAPSPPPSPPPSVPSPRSTAVARVPAALPPTGAAGRRIARDPAGARSRTPPAGPVPQIPLPRRAPAARSAEVPRRRPGARAAPEAAAPEGFAMPAVLGQSWARDPGTLRRLIAGLRRMT